MREVMGKVFLREIDYGNDLEFVTEVRGKNGELLSEVLDEFDEGEYLKITIEVVKKQ